MIQVGPTSEFMLLLGQMLHIQHCATPGTPHPSYAHVFWRNLKSCLAKRQKELSLYELLSFTHRSRVSRIYHTTNRLRLASGLGMNKAADRQRGTFSLIPLPSSACPFHPAANKVIKKTQKSLHTTGNRGSELISWAGATTRLLISLGLKSSTTKCGVIFEK